MSIPSQFVLLLRPISHFDCPTTPMLHDAFYSIDCRSLRGFCASKNTKFDSRFLQKIASVVDMLELLVGPSLWPIVR